MGIVTKEEAAVRLKVHLNTVVNYLQRCPGAAVRDREISRAVLVDIDRLVEWMREAMPEKYGDLVIDDRDMPLEQLGQTVHVAGSQVAEPIEVEAVEVGGEGSGEGSGDRGIVAGLLGENLKMVQESHRATVGVLTGQVAARRWALRAAVAGVVVLAGALWGMGWFLSRAQGVAIERAERIAVGAVRIDRLEGEVESVGRRAGRLEDGLAVAVAGREALGGRLVELTAEKGRLELVVSQGEDERAGKERMILEMSGRIEELENMRLTTENTENTKGAEVAEGYDGRVKIADSGKVPGDG